MKTFIPLLCCLLMLNACFYNGSNRVVPPQELKVPGYKPVYTADTSWRIVTYTSTPQPAANAGKIYVKGTLIFQCEIGKGIHIIDNTVPAQAKRIAFLSVKGCEEIAIKGNYLYTNNYYDLVTIDISVPENAHTVARSRDAFYTISSSPHTWEEPEQSGYFQCPLHYSDSVISGWRLDSISAGCYK